tara:strand:- start:166 stop:444 length:279 start_codon:yes stop_codon:yes gene_type:complete
MTDLSSDKEKEVMADMAADLIETKLENAKKDTQMTHVLRIGTFHMEIVPDAKIDVAEVFSDALDKLMDKYGDKLLEISIAQLKQENAQAHYG